ncbi:MAG: hypothetical protein JNM56_08910 [Planctomycetia bacterium]|nr:hypothetical protein [Planctomycetia bacterium]
MNHQTVDTLPELESIQTMLSDLMPVPPPSPPRARPPAEFVAPGRNGARASGGPAVLGACTVRQFLHGVNWDNRPGFASPLRRPTPALGNAGGERRVLGALPLREFLAKVNWRNAADAPALELHAPAQPDHARLVIDTFMNEIDWD